MSDLAMKSRTKGIVVAGLLLSLANLVQSEPPPQPALKTQERFEALGVPLERTLLRLSMGHSVHLEASRELKAQRVTLLIARPDQHNVEMSLVELLSADRDARVTWEILSSGAKRLSGCGE
jgi:hypothetical protein